MSLDMDVSSPSSPVHASTSHPHQYVQPTQTSDHALILKRLLSRQASWHDRLSHNSHTRLGNVASPPSSSGCSPEGSPVSTPRLKGLSLGQGALSFSLSGLGSTTVEGWSLGQEEDHLKSTEAFAQIGSSASTSAFTTPDCTRPSSRVVTPVAEHPPSSTRAMSRPNKGSGGDWGAHQSLGFIGDTSSRRSSLGSPYYFNPIDNRVNCNHVPVVQPSPRRAFSSFGYNDPSDPGYTTQTGALGHSSRMEASYAVPQSPGWNPSSFFPRPYASSGTGSTPQFVNSPEYAYSCIRSRPSAPPPNQHASANPSYTGSGSGDPSGDADPDPDADGAEDELGEGGEDDDGRGDGDGSGSGNGQDEGRGSGGGRKGIAAGKAAAALKKKAAKACLQCQKAHLTCDDVRPCTRCVSKGLGEACEEGRRKKAKYLMTEEEKALAIPRKRANAARTETANGPIRQSSDEGEFQQHPSPIGFVQSPPPLPYSAIPPLTAVPHLGNTIDQSVFDQLQGNGGPALLPQSQPFLSQPMLVSASGQGLGFFGDCMPNGDEFLQDSDPIFNLNFDPNYQFGSQAANLEYTMLSSMFADAAMNNPANNFDNSLFQLDVAWPSTDAPELCNAGGPDLMTGVQQDILGGDPLEGPPFSLDSIKAAGGMGVPATSQDPMTLQHQYNAHHPFSSAARLQQNDASMDSPGGSTLTQNTQASASLRMITPSMVYSQVTRPYDYTEGYHYLMRYLAKHFDQSESLKVVKSLAAFRPSLIALQMPLTIEDEVFLEKSFQRTLIELEKLLSFSGTPTAVWRRTGELCLVSDEFCKLVQLSKTQLLGKKTYVYELFENQSVIDYFERFSQHAFENTTQNFFMRCGLVTSQTKLVSCSCSFTIRRDVFDLPSAVIGQVLPVDP